MVIVGYIFISLGLCFILVGLIGIFKNNNFYSRILCAADIDTVGLITILIGVAFVSGFNTFTLKVLVILAVIMLLNPVVTSSIASSAYFSGYKPKQEDKKDD